MPYPRAHAKGSVDFGRLVTGETKDHGTNLDLVCNDVVDILGVCSVLFVRRMRALIVCIHPRIHGKVWFGLPSSFTLLSH